MFFLIQYSDWYYIWAVPCKKDPYGEDFQHWLFKIENDRLEFKLSEYEIRAWYRAYLLRFRLSIRKVNRAIAWTIF